MNDINLDRWLAVCEMAARAGGQELLHWRGKFKSREKAPADLVTDADVASQFAVQSVIEKEFPEHAFLGEESDSHRTGGADQLTWVVDPLDGTTNYVHGYAQYAVSVALVRGGEILAGVVYDPVRDECYAAAHGRGATCHEKPLRVSRVRTMGEALVAVSLPARVVSDSPDLGDFVTAAQCCQAARRTGSAALNLAYVASGAFDAFWATHIHPWDVAAGVLLIREAGGVVTARHGETFDLWRPTFLAAATPELHADLLAVLGRGE